MHLPISIENVHAAAPAARVALSRFDTLGLEQLATGDTAAVVEHARGLAHALAGPDASGARLRTLSRAIAVAQTQQSLLDALLLERLAKRDAAGVELVEKASRTISARLMKLLEAHRLETGQRLAPMVSVGTVNINGNW